MCLIRFTDPAMLIQKIRDVYKRQIEVKADKNVTAKSLAYYRKQYLPKLSIRLSALNMRKDDDLLNLRCV